MALSLVATACVAILVYALWLIFRDYVTSSPLDNVPGPPSSSFVLGNIPELIGRQSWKQWEIYVNTYGPVIKIHGMLGGRMLHVYDPKALHSILIKDVEIYPKTLAPTSDLHMLLGPGLLTTEGAQNRKQRKLLNPVFSVAHLRNMTHIFYNISYKLRDAIDRRLGNNGAVIDVNGWMARTTLEMLGQAGLGYSFDNFEGDSTDAYGESLKTFFPNLNRIIKYSFLIPKIANFLSESTLRKLARAAPHPDIQRMMEISDTMAQRSIEIINEKKAALLKGGDSLVHQIGEGKDIMSLLLKANMAASEAERHTDEELIAQMSTLILGGMDTTSNALSRVFHLLAERPDIQDKLRAEIIEACNGEILSHDNLIKLPFLDAVCRETLRLYAPVQFTSREVAQDAKLPLLSPIRGVDGTMMSEIAVPKGTIVLLNYTGSNTNRELWGDDASEWKPERWLGQLPPALDDARVPGVYSNLMTFSGGGRSCIGFKFSQLEMKVVMVVLLSAFKFELTEKPIAWNSSAVTYPTTGEENTRPEMFLKVSQVSR
ncbi:cytochrome P450 [Cubamyces sp. BRFM 1775]|nr:cytochrome P450 [Cubamyces sp. BRFM 1775]